MRFAQAEGYLPTTQASRATLLAVIFGVHLAAIAAVLSIKGVVAVVQVAPMLVQILPERSAPKPLEPTRTIPMPAMKLPDIRLPNPPPIENTITVKMVEEKPAPAPVVSAPVSIAPVAAAPPSIEPPRGDLAYLNNPAPAYPVFAKRAREQGTVTLRVRVDIGGSVEGIEIHNSSGSKRLDDAALAAVRRWRFQPARLGDRAVAGVALVPIHFQLEG